MKISIEGLFQVKNDKKIITPYLKKKREKFLNIEPKPIQPIFIKAKPKPIL